MTILAAVVFAGCAGGLAAAEPPVPAGGSATLEWDWSGADTTGQPETLLKYQVAALTADGLTLVSAVDVDATTQGAQTASIDLSTLELTAGIYILQVRAVDTSGNASDWSTPLMVVYEVSAPVPPSQPRIKITVIVEIG